MTKKEICQNNKTFAYYSGFGGVEFKNIEYGINDCLYCVSNAWYGGEHSKKYHKLKIYYNDKGSYVKLHGVKIPLDECVRTDI